MDLFFVISGLIMVVTTQHRAPGAPSAREFLRRRAVRVYPIYWVATLPVLVLFLVGPDTVNSSAENPPDVLASLFLLPQPGLPLLMVGWTLTFEMYFYLVFALVLLLPRSGRLPALAAWGVLTLALAGAFAGSGNPWLATIGAPIVLEFLFGAAVGALVVRKKFVTPLLCTTAGLVGTATALAVGDFPGTWYRALPVGLCLAVAVYGVVGLEGRWRLIAPAWLQRLGDASYSLYLWHVLVLSAVGRIVLVRLPADPLVHAAALAFSTALVIVSALIAYHLVEQPLIRLFRRPVVFLPDSEPMPDSVPSLPNSPNWPARPPVPAQTRRQARDQAAGQATHVRKPPGNQGAYQARDTLHPGVPAHPGHQTRLRAGSRTSAG